MSSLESLENRVKVRPTLSFMPHQIKEMIAEKTDIKTRYTLRKVSTHFRAAVDASKCNFERVFIRKHYAEKKVTISLNYNLSIEYSKNGENGVVRRYRAKRTFEEDDLMETEKIIEGEDFIQMAVNDLGIILKSPNVFCRQLILIEKHRRDPSDIRLKRCLLEKFDCLRHQLSVGELDCDFCTDQEDALSILRCVKPRTLKSLCFNHPNTMNFDKIVATEHWPFLKEVTFDYVKGVPISKFLHLREFYIWNFPLTKNDVEEIVQSILQRPDSFDSYSFLTDDRDMVQMYKEALSDHWPNRKRIPIPGTDFHLEIVFDEQEPCHIGFHRRRNG